MKKRWLGLLLILTMALCLLPAAALAEGENERHVNSSEALLAAIADESVSVIHIDTDLWISEPISIERELTLRGKGGNQIVCRKEVTVKNGGALILDGYFFMSVIDSACAVEAGGALTVEQDAALIITPSSDAASFALASGGTLTLRGSLILESESAFSADGTLNIENGTFRVCSMENLKKVAPLGGRLCLDGLTIDEDYTLDMGGSTLKITGNFMPKNGAILTVTNAQRVESGGATWIDGVTFDCPLHLRDAEGNIRGGVFRGDVSFGYGAGTILDGEFYGKVTGGTYTGAIEGGSFFGPVDLSGTSGGNNVTGGTFYDELILGESRIAGLRVTYQADGADYAFSVVPGGHKTAAPKAPEKDGYDFDGWYLDDTAYDFESPVNENLTLTAHWKLKPETPAQEPKTDNPKAGDTADFALWITLAVIGGAGAVAAAAREKKLRRVK